MSLTYRGGVKLEGERGTKIGGIKRKGKSGNEFNTTSHYEKATLTWGSVRGIMDGEREVCPMTYRIKFVWDDEAAVWIATSDDVPGLVLEGGSFDALVERVKSAVPELIEMAGRRARGVRNEELGVRSLKWSGGVRAYE